MPEVADQGERKRFACDGCAKTYPWKPELTNKKAKCKCGVVITVPDLSEPEPTDDDPPALPDEGIFDYIDSAPEVASAKLEAVRAVSMPVAAPVATPKKKAPPVLGYRNGPTQQQRRREAERAGAIHSVTRDVYVPIGLIVGSFVAYFTFLYLSGAATSGTSILVYGAGMALLFAIKTVCMIGGAFIVASLASVSFGPFSTAILKLAAVAIAPDIVGTMIDETGIPMLGWGVSLVLYWTLIAQLFGMGADEAWMVVVLFGVLRFVMNMVIAMFIVGLLFSGSSVGTNAVAGAAVIMAPSNDAAEFDKEVGNWKDNEALVEANEYIAKGRQSGLSGAVKMLYDAGARNVWFAIARDFNGKTEPICLVAQWPRDAKKRPEMLKAINEWEKLRAKMYKEAHPDWGDLDYTPTTDEGGKYVRVPMGAG